jgi:glutamate formiminotransferase / 5-formyltetrahydrofolate cyclo-ligase
MASYVLSDPNMSDGTHPEVIEAIVDELRGRDGVKVIGYEPDPDFDRLPVEVLGRPEALKDALLDMAGKSYELIDMERQHGHHPRIGAVDTIQLYPLADVTLDECVELAEELGRELYERYEVPVYFTGENARSEERRTLAVIRAGNYEGLKEAVHLPGREPDIGPPRLHPTAGATIVGAERSHDAYFNVVLGTADVEIAKRLARAVRAKSGGFANIKGAIGLPLTQRGCVAVSMEISDPLETPLHRVFNLIEAEARRYGVPVVGGQICGVVAQDVLVQCAEWYLRLESINGPFDPKRQIIENHLLELAGMPV